MPWPRSPALIGVSVLVSGGVSTENPGQVQDDGDPFGSEAGQWEQEKVGA